MLNDSAAEADIVRHHQVPRGPEQGVEDQRRNGGVQPDHGRYAGDRRVRQRLRNQHGPHREAGDQVEHAPTLRW